MKIKNIAAICKKNKAIVLFEKHSESGDTVIQYIGDGGAAYDYLKCALSLSGDHIESEGGK